MFYKTRFPVFEEATKNNQRVHTVAWAAIQVLWKGVCEVQLYLNHSHRSMIFWHVQNIYANLDRPSFHGTWRQQNGRAQARAIESTGSALWRESRAHLPQRTRRDESWHRTSTHARTAPGDTSRPQTHQVQKRLEASKNLASAPFKLYCDTRFLPCRLS